MLRKLCMFLGRVSSSSSFSTLDSMVLQPQSSANIMVYISLSFFLFLSLALSFVSGGYVYNLRYFWPSPLSPSLSFPLFQVVLCTITRFLAIPFFLFVSQFSLFSLFHSFSISIMDHVCIKCSTNWFV